MMMMMMMMMMLMIVTRSRMIDIRLRVINDLSMDSIDDFVKRDGRSDGRTDTPAYWDASKNELNFLRVCIKLGS